VTEAREYRAANSEGNAILMTRRLELEALGDNIFGVLKPECSQAAVYSGKPYESGTFVACEDEDVSYHNHIEERKVLPWMVVVIKIFEGSGCVKSQGEVYVLAPQFGFCIRRMHDTGSAMPSRTWRTW
jgi:hypothetical protein